MSSYIIFLDVVILKDCDLFANDITFYDTNQ